MISNEQLARWRLIELDLRLATKTAVSLMQKASSAGLIVKPPEFVTLERVHGLTGVVSILWDVDYAELTIPLPEKEEEKP